MSRARTVALPLALALALAVPSGASAFNEYVVDRTDDSVATGYNGCGSSPNDCTLRGALDVADGSFGADLVSLPPGVFRRDPALDFLTILQSVTIAGAGARSTIIEGPNTPGKGPALEFVVQGGQTTPNTSAIRDVTITKGNHNGGGGIFTENTNLSLDRVLVTGNVAPGNDFMSKIHGIGAGIGFNTAGRTLTIDNSTISGNRAEGKAGQSADGAGLVVYGASATIRSSTIAGNVADGDGGAAVGAGLSSEANGSVTLDRVTVAGNRAEDVGAGQAVANLWRDAGSKITATRSIIADGIAPAGSNSENCALPIISQGSNVEDRNQCGLAPGKDRVNANVGLGPLANNGGTTNTRAISKSSAAFDFAGACLFGDQRGFGRAFAACDSGAFELQPSEVVSGPGRGPGPGGPGADRLAPSFVRRPTFVPSRFRAAAAPTPISARTRAVARGSALTYALSEPAVVTIAVQRPGAGRRVGRSCRRSTRALSGRPRCVRWVTVGTLRRRSLQGASTKAFTGRIGRRKLAPGAYRAAVTARDAAGNGSSVATARFTLVG